MSGGSLAILGSPVDDLRQLCKRPEAVLRLCLGQVALEPFALLRAGLLSHQRGDLLHVDTGVPQVEGGHRGEALDGLPIRARHGEIDRVALFGVEVSISAGHGETSHQPLHVPLEGARQGLVEVVDAEHKPPIGPRETTEVRQMRIATELHL